MTDQPPTDDPGDVVVVGQRRSEPWQPFPERPTLVRPDPDVAVLPDEETGPLDPCFNPETALDWNADAAAAAALRRMIAAALAQNDPTHNLANREYGAMICQAPNGDLSISSIRWGDPIFDAEGNWVGYESQPSVDVRLSDCGGGTRPLAMIHSHPSTGPNGAIPSRPDASWVAGINNLRGDNLGRIYVVSIGADGSFRIEIYDSSNVEAGSESGVPGPEVNPDGQPCPGVSIG